MGTGNKTRTLQRSPFIGIQRSALHLEQLGRIWVGEPFGYTELEFNYLTKVSPSAALLRPHTGSQLHGIAFEVILSLLCCWKGLNPSAIALLLDVKKICSDPKVSHLLWRWSVCQLPQTEVDLNPRLYRDHWKPSIPRMPNFLNQDPQISCLFSWEFIRLPFPLEDIDVSENLSFIFLDGVLLDK